MELFPDDAFPNDTPEDKAKSNSDSTFVHVCILLIAYSRMTIPGYDYHDFIATLILSSLISRPLPNYV